MNVQEIRDIAKQMGLTPGKKPKLELVRLIQNTEGNFECLPPLSAANATSGVACGGKTVSPWRRKLNKRCC